MTKDPINLHNADTLKKPGTPIPRNGKAYSTGETPVYLISGELSTLGNSENSQRSAALKADLIKLVGAKSLKQVRGCYKGAKEVAFVVYCKDRDALIDLAETYNQESILFLDSSRRATLFFIDPRHPDGTEYIGRFQEVPIEEALAAEAYTFDISQNSYYIVK